MAEVDGPLYTGQTESLLQRIGRHNKGLVRAIRAKTPYRLGFFEEHVSRSEAMWREWELKKRWNTERKKKLIQDLIKQR